MCRLLAENLAANDVSVDVLTTCARDHFTWRNELAAGESVENGVGVRRFAVTQSRDHERWLAAHGRIDQGHRVDYVDQLEWMGNSVWSEGIQDAVADTRRYDWVIAIPYLFGTSFWAVAERPNRTCLIPCVHDEPHAWTPIVRDMLTAARGCLTNSRGEADLLTRLAPDARHRIVGVGYEQTPTPTPADVDAFCRARNIAPGYLLYAGRREVAKNVPMLFSHYAAYRRANPAAPPLAMMGSGDLAVPPELADHVIELGYVPQADVDVALASASVLIHPSRMESLGMVLLEAWLAGTPALVNGESVVLSDHCLSSDGGLVFGNEAEFCSALDTMLSNDVLRQRMAANGAAYTLEQFSWPAVRGRLFAALEEWS